MKRKRRKSLSFFSSAEKIEGGMKRRKGAAAASSFFPFFSFGFSLSPDHKFLPCAAAPDTIRAIAIAERRKREEAIVVGGEGGDCSKGELEGFLEVSERRVAPPLPLVEDIWL